MKKTEIILFLIVGILTMVVILSFIFFRNKPNGTPTPQPVLLFSPSPTPGSDLQIPPSLGQEREGQESYARAREEFLKAKPWVTKLPLKSNDYFVTYNPQTDRIIAEIYYSGVSEISVEQQLSQAKEKVRKALVNIGIDTQKQKIEYLEIARE